VRRRILIKKRLLMRRRFSVERSPSELTRVVEESRYVILNLPGSRPAWESSGSIYIATRSACVL
jgi:hypothetical protein